MKHIFLAFTVACSVLSQPSLGAEWRQTNGPYGGSPHRIAMHPANPKVLLAGFRGLYRTENGGESWERVALPSLPAMQRVSGIAFSPAQPDTAYCMLHGASAFLASRDAGKTWEVRQRHLHGPTSLRGDPEAHIVPDPFDPNRLYISLSPGAGKKLGFLQISEDGGKTFRAPTTPKKLSAHNLHCDPRHEGVLLADSLVGPSEWPILLSRNHGESWTEIPHPTGSSKDSVVWHNLDPQDEELLYVATRVSGGNQMSYWYTYFEEGENWELFYREGAGIKRDEAMEKKLAAIFPPEIRFTDIRNRVMADLVIAPTDRDIIYYISSEHGLRRTLDGGKTWETLTEGLTCQIVPDVIPHPTKPAAAFCRAKLSYYRTDDLGEHWTSIMTEGLKSASRLAVHALKPDTLFMGFRSELWRSDDGGKSWRPIFSDKENPFRTAIFDPDDENTYHFVHLKNIRTTTDDGETWSETAFGPLGSRTLIFATRSGEHPLALVIRGRTLHIFSPGKEPYTATVVDGKRLGAFAVRADNGSHLAAVLDDRMILSTDTGSTWQRTRLRRFQEYSDHLVFDPLSENVVLLTRSQGTVIAHNCETGKQRTICKVADEAHLSISALAVSVDGKTIWAGTEGKGVWILRREDEAPGQEQEQEQEGTTRQ